MTYVLKCPGCKNKMKYQAMKKADSHRKKCVYCGTSFKVEDNIVRKL